MGEPERIVVGDTETTGIGFRPDRTGHRMVEIGLIEMVGNVETGERFHVYLNPGRTVDPEAQRVHGLSDDFLKDKPRFRDVADGFDAFVGDAPLVFHNASFDMAFIRGEREMLGRRPLKNEVRDSLALARRMWPGQRSSLDALCSRLNVDNSRRDLHGALVDASILAEVWVKMNGMDRLALGGDAPAAAPQAAPSRAALTMIERRPRLAREALRATPEEAEAFAAFIASSVKDPAWAAAQIG